MEYKEPSVDKVSWEYTRVILFLEDSLEMYRMEMDLEWSEFL